MGTRAMTFIALGWFALCASAGAQADTSPGLGRRILSPRFGPPAGQTKVAVAFFDADLTLRISKSGAPTANGPKDVRLLPRVARTIARLNRQGYLVAVVSNQAGVPRFVSLETADAALAETARRIARLGGRVDWYDFAEHRDEDRKPGIGMALRLESFLRDRHGLTLDKERSFMVGDAAYKKPSPDDPGDLQPNGLPGTDFSNSDRLFAEGYGVRFFRAPDFFR